MTEQLSEQRRLYAIFEREDIKLLEIVSQRPVDVEAATAQLRRRQDASEAYVKAVQDWIARQS